MNDYHINTDPSGSSHVDAIRSPHDLARCHQ
jgi:hypothetical protein